MAIPAGRFDWDTFIDELGPERLLLLEALWLIEPWGDDRADRRMQVQTRILAAAAGNKEEIDDELFNYLGLADDEEPDFEASEEAVNSMLGKAAIRGG